MSVEPGGLKLWVALMGWLIQSPGSEAATAASAFAIQTNHFAGPPLVGYGVQMSPYLTAPNQGQPVGNLADLEQKLKALAPQHVRVFVETDWWQPGKEKVRDSFVSTCQMAQAVGASINVTLWRGWGKDPAGASKAMAQLLRDLVHNHSVTAARYVTLQNEVNSTRITMERYDAFYRMFDRDQRAIGLRDQVQIVGGDLIRKNQDAWFRNLATELGDVCDGYSVHMYWEYPQAGDYLRRRLNELAVIQDQLPIQKRLPIYITEFGVRGKNWQVRGNEPGSLADGTPVAQSGIYALQVGWLMTEATRGGFVATVQWDAYDVAYPGNRMRYGVLGEAREGWPRRPSFQVLRLFTHTIAPGWRALAINGESRDVALAAVRGPKGELTVMALNHSKQDQAVSLAGLPSGRTFRRLLWSAAEKDQIQDSGDTAIGAASLSLTLPPDSLTSLTSGSARWKELEPGSPFGATN